MNICICIFILHLDMLSLYPVTCMYVYRADHLVLRNQLMCSFQDKIFFPSSIFFSCLQFFPTTLVCLLLFLFSSFLDCHVHETLWV